MFGFGKVRCRKRWCRRSFTRSYRGFINSEILGWYHQRLGISWCREHNPMKGNDVTFMQKPEGEEKPEPWLKLEGPTVEEAGERLKSAFGPLTKHEQDVVDYIASEMDKLYAYVCLLCANGDHTLLVGNPRCECCPNHYTKTLNDL